MAVQPGLYQTWSKTRRLVFSERGSYAIANSVEQDQNLSIRKRDFNLEPSIAGVSLNPQVMVGFHQPTIQQPMMPQIGVPIPIHQLNSYIMQQAKMGPPNVPTPRFMSARVMQEQVNNMFILMPEVMSNVAYDWSTYWFYMADEINVWSKYCVFDV